MSVRIDLCHDKKKKYPQRYLYPTPYSSQKSLSLFSLGSQSNKLPSLSKYILNLSAFFISNVTTLIKNFITSHLILIDLSPAFGLSMQPPHHSQMLFLKFKRDHITPFLINFNTFSVSQEVDSF